MIINSILSLAFLWSCKKCIQQLKEFTALRKKIINASILSVADAIKKMETVPEGKKVFMIIRGLLKLRRNIQGEKSIYSIVELSEIRQGKLSDHLMRKSWESLASNVYWRQPHNIRTLSFDLQDMDNLNEKVLIKSCKQANLSGALNEVYKDYNITNRSPNIFVKIGLKLYDFFVSRAPLSYIFNTTKVGEQLTLYSILNGQYSLVIGEFERLKDSNELICSLPNYVTKQRCYIESKLRKQEKKLILITFLLIILLIITFIKFIRKLFDYLKQWKRQQQIRYEQNHEERSQNEGENCNCIVCFENVRNIVFKPCRHYAVCKSCYQQLPRQICPYCKVQIEDIIEIVKKK